MSRGRNTNGLINQTTVQVQQRRCREPSPLDRQTARGFFTRAPVPKTAGARALFILEVSPHLDALSVCFDGLGTEAERAKCCFHCHYYLSFYSTRKPVDFICFTLKEDKVFKLNTTQLIWPSATLRIKINTGHYKKRRNTLLIVNSRES